MGEFYTQQPKEANVKAKGNQEKSEDPLHRRFVVDRELRDRLLPDELTPAGLVQSAEIPHPVAQEIQATGHEVAALRIAVKSDLGPDGQFGEQWLLIDDRSLMVVDRPNGRSYLRHNFELNDIQDAKIERCVGNGLMQVTVVDKPHVLLHYSNDLTDRFGRVAHYLQERAKNGPDTPVPDANADKHTCLSCGRYLADHSSTVCPNCIERGKIFKRLVLQARPYWASLGIVVVLLLLSTVTDLMPPYLTRIMIDDVLEPGGNAGLLLQLVLALLVIQIIHVGLMIWRNWLTINVSGRFTAEIRDKLFAHLKKLPVDYFDKHQTGRLMTRINQDTNELQGLFSQMTTFVFNLLVVLGIGIVLFSMAPSLGLYVLIPTPFVMIAAYFYYRYMRPHFRRFWIARWRLNAMLNTFIAGVRVVKAFAQEDQEEARYHQRNNDMLQTQLQVDLAWSKFFPLISFAFSAGGLIIRYTGGLAVLDGRITLGTLMAFIGYLGMFYGPLSNLTHVSQALNRFLTISQRTFELLDEAEQVQPAQPVSKPAISGEISFDRVTFGYDPYFPVINDVSFKVEAGEMVGVVGHSGAGKTTIVNLMCRFYDVTRGAISIDGIDLRDLSMEEIRQQIGMVLQSPYLFEGTLAENIAYGKPGATYAEIVRAAKAANAHDFITGMPEGYDTIVGEGGSGLSGGERQRISIARAILHDPRILILDEATSSVDTETERQIQEALNELVKGRTTIAIAHRLSTLYKADRILVLNQGKLEEQGTPKELIDKQGSFYNLVQMQSEMARIDGSTAVL
jgi:ATP-binding cassette, subfamily B, bacterial